MLTQITALDTASVTYYTPWFPRGAENAAFSLEKVADTIGNGGVTFGVVTKNREDEGSGGTSAGSFSSVSGGFYEATCTGLSELVRFTITFRATAVGQGVIFRFLPPTWYDKAV
ncbi:MAG: hypothetical protein K8J09_01965 [Planctomycetes bacterium]|nr:hypothetical protein [Planctomycetota bacterium]